MPLNSDILVEGKSLEFSYPGHSPVLIIDELKLEAGAHVFLHGPSGTGKTTLLGLLSGVLTPQKGHLKILDTEMANLSPGQRDRFRGKNIGYILYENN